ncbi:MAG: NAD(P)-dependent oxidoreductase [Kibdelosporangium sp.]
MKVLVTGAGGALGGLVAEQLAAAGWSVRAHDRKPVRVLADDMITGDLTDLAHVRAVVTGIDAVVHCAAIPSPVDHPDAEIFRNNVETSYNVLDTAGRAGVGRIVNVSSASAIGLAWSRLGLSPLSVPVTEEHPYVGEDVYGLSKQVGEVVAGAASRRWQAAVVSLRFPFIGTGSRLRTHLRPIHEDPGVDRGGLWTWLDIRDAVRAIAAALTVPLEGHHVLNVAAPDTTALVPTRDLLRRYHPAARIDRELGEFESLYSSARSRDVLGFEPVYGWRGVEL